MHHEVLLASVLGAHGLKGEVRVKAFTEEPDGLGAYGTLHAKDGRVFTLESVRPGKEGECIAAFAEVRDREAAEALKGTDLFVSRTALPQTAGGEFYHADLIGLDATDPEGRHIGKVAAIHNYGAGDVIVITADTGDEIMIAFTRENVPEIDVKASRLTVAVPDEVDAGDHPGVE